MSTTGVPKRGPATSQDAPLRRPLSAVVRLARSPSCHTLGSGRRLLLPCAAGTPRREPCVLDASHNLIPHGQPSQASQDSQDLGYSDSGGRPGHFAVQRRLLLAAAAQAVATAACICSAPAASAFASASPTSFLQPLLPSPTPDLLAQLEGRAPILQPGVAWALRNRDRQLRYPSWLAGEWAVEARFAAASFPQGRRLVGRTVPGVLKGSMVVALPDVGAGIDGAVRYRARYATSPEEGGVVADRVFNVQQLMDAFYGFEVTRRVEYEPLKNPTRLTVVYATPRQEKSVISEDLRKAELIINNRISEQLSPTEFICGELFRQISQASAQGFVGDYETITKFALLPVLPSAPGSGEVAEPSTGPRPGGLPEVAGGPSLAAEAVSVVGSRVRVLQRVASFLQPQDAAFFEARNQAVAAYDYTYDMTRVA